MKPPVEQTCLVTGGAGFIGCAVSGELADQFRRVIVLDSLLPQVHPSGLRPPALDPRVELVVGDIRDSQLWDSVLSDIHPGTVIHLAAETGTGQSLGEAARHTGVNVLGTAEMADAFLRTQALPSKVVLASSRAIYGEGAWTRRDGSSFYPEQRTTASVADGEWDFPDATPNGMDASSVNPTPVSIYGATKLAQENILSVWSKAFDVQLVTLRLQNVFGPGQSIYNSYTGILTLFCRIAAAGRPIPLYEDGLVRRDFVFIDDVARVVVAAATMAGAPFRPIDVGSGSYRTIADAAQLITERYGSPEPFVTGQFREGDVRHAWADPSAARAALDWSARVSLEVGIARLAEWLDCQDLPPL